ncbi:MAG: ABC transporter permease subunit [Acidimicrobiaceae bacterium]|nr:ABC transporter permease subunit [Acidimicrobiaceae bacterium]
MLSEPRRPPLWRTARRLLSRGSGLIAVVCFIGLWQWYGSSYAHASFLFSRPSTVASSFAHVVGNMQLPRAFADSVAEEAVGFAIAAALAIGVGALMGRVRYVEFALDPLVTIGIATPVIVLLPVMENWFGFGSTSRVAFIVVLSVWPILINTWSGIATMGAAYHLVGRSLGLGRLQQLRMIILPAAAPYIFAGLRLGLANATLAMVVAGQEVGDAGLGGLTEIYGQQGEVGQLIAVILSSTALALLLFWLLRVVERRGFSWIAATGAGGAGA